MTTRKINANMETPIGERILFLDLLKIIAAFFTVFYHFAYYKLDYGFVERMKYFPNINRIIMCFAACCVPLFFIVYGTLMFSREHRWKIMYKKAAKMLALIFIWSFAGFPSWFFKTLIILYIMFPVFQYCFKSKRMIYSLLIVIIFIMPFLYNIVLLGMKCMRIHSIGVISIDELNTTGLFTMYSILYFLLGPILKEKKKNFWRGIICVLIGWGMVILECVIYTNLNQVVYDGVNSAFPTIGALFLSIEIFDLARCYHFKYEVVSWFSNCILLIYLLHALVIKGIMTLGGGYELSLVTGVLGSIVICLVCALIGKVMGRIPGLGWLVRM